MGRSVIVVHPRFDREWPFAADHVRRLLEQQGAVEFVRLADDDTRTLHEIVAEPAEIERLFALQVPVTPACIGSMKSLHEAAIYPWPNETLRAVLDQRNVRVYVQPTEGFWGESVAECGLALTLCGLRRIPQLHRQIISDQSPWDYRPPNDQGRPGARGIQFGDDPAFSSGTVAGKRVRVVGAGNIASRYASFVRMLGADVAAWDPFASEPSFHRAGTRKEWHLDRLVRDAEIFAPMVPLTDATQGIVTAQHIDALPRGCLVVLVTRARICDMDALRRRVLADELSLAADVFDAEPLPLDDPLLGRHNVVHTPHIAGRTIHANQQWAEKLVEQFL